MTNPDSPDGGMGSSPYDKWRDREARIQVLEAEIATFREIRDALHELRQRFHPLRAERDRLAKENAELREALTRAKEKLEIYRNEVSGEYSGGMEFTALMRFIDAALQQQNNAADSEREEG